MPPSLDAKTALLQALMKGDSFGLELIDRVKELTNGQIALGQGSVYPALRSLEAEGFLEGSNLAVIGAAIAGVAALMSAAAYFLNRRGSSVKSAPVRREWSPVPPTVYPKHKKRTADGIILANLSSDFFNQFPSLLRNWNHGATPACEEFHSDAGSRGV